MDDSFKTAFVEGYLRASEMTPVEVEAHRRTFTALAQSIEEARAHLIEAAVKSGLISADEAAEMARAHEARRREVEKQLDDLRGRIVRPPTRSM